MRLSDLDEEKLEDWRDEEPTAVLCKQLHADLLACHVRIEELGSTGDEPHKVAALCGRAAELRRILKLIEETKGSA